MAWNMNAAKRRALVKLQLRDKHGRWIEMGGGVKWYSSRLKKTVAGVVVGTKGQNALVRLNKENGTHEPSLVSVPAHNIEVVDQKASLSPKGAPDAGQTPDINAPEKVADVAADPNAEADSDHMDQLKGPQHLAANYGITETSDGHTYITRNDGEPIYSSARELKVGDELISPAGADPTKPFSIGRNWATKGTERLNKDGEGPIIGKVIAISENRYAVVQMAGGHTIPDRRNPDEMTDTVTVGLSNKVILATMGLKDALGDKVSNEKYAERPASEEKVVDVSAPEAQSDHVGREVPEDQLDAAPDAPKAPETLAKPENAEKKMTDVSVEEMSKMPVGTVLRDPAGKLAYFVKQDGDNWEHHLSSGKSSGAISTSAFVKSHDVFNNHTFAKPGTEPNKAEAPQNAPEASPAPDAPATPEKPVEDAPKAPEAAPAPDAPAKEAPAAPEAPAEAPAAPEAPKGISEAQKRFEKTQDEVNGLPYDDPRRIAADSAANNVADTQRESGLEKFSEEWYALYNSSYDSALSDNEAKSAPSDNQVTPVHDIIDGLADLEQASEDISNANDKLSQDDITETIDGSSFDVTAADGNQYHVTMGQDENGDWNFIVQDANGAESSSHVIGSDENSVIAESIAKGSSVPSENAPEAPKDAAPAENAPEAPAAPESYNENGLTADEQRQVDGAMRLATRSYDQFRDAEGDRYKAMADELLAKGEARKSSAPAEATPAPEAPAAPESAPITGPTDAQKIANAEKMYGTGSPQHKEAQRRFGQSDQKDTTPAQQPEKAPESAPQPEKAPEATPEVAKPVEDAPAPSLVEPTKDVAPAVEAPAKAAPFGISFERRADGLEHAVAARPEAFTPAEAEEFRKLDVDLAWAQHENRSGREATARGRLADLGRRVQTRLDSQSFSRKSGDDGSNNDSVEKTAAPKAEPKAPDAAPENAPDPVATPEQPSTPDISKDEPTPLTDEQMGQLHERLNGPSINEDGLLPEEAARLSELEKRTMNSYSPNHPYDEPVEPLEKEINEILEHGEARKRGDAVGPFVASEPVPDYNPSANAPENAPEAPAVPENAPAAPQAPEVAPEAPQAPEVAPAAPEAPAAPAAPRTRSRNGEATPVADADGNMISRGDKIGHPTHGPVEVVNTIPGSGRVEFIDPTTGRKKSVKAANVRRIDPNAAPSESVDSPTTATPGERFVDSATGKRGFGDKNGNRVLVGDRVTDANGNTGEVASVYTAANGQAWIPVKWDSDGKTRRVMGAQLTKADAAPARPSTNDHVSEPAVPEATPVNAPEAPQAPAPVETHETATARRQQLIDSVPVNSMITSDDGTQKFYKVSDTQWQFNEGSLLSNAGVLNMMALGERRGMKFNQAEGRPAQVNLPQPKVPEAPATPESPAPSDPNVDTPGRRAQLLNRLRSLPVGTRIASRNGEQIFTKQGDDNWGSNVDPGSVLNGEDISNLLLRGHGRGLRYETTSPGSEPAAPEAPAEVALAADSLVPPTVASRLEAFRNAPIGTTVTSPAGTATYTKTGTDEWTSPDLAGATIRHATMAVATDSDNGYWIFNKTGVAKPEGTNITAMGVTERLRAMRMAPVGSKLTSTNGQSYTKTTSRIWKDAAGNEKSAADLSYIVNDTAVTGPYGLTLPEGAVPAIENGTMLPRYNAEERKAMLTAAPVGTIAKSTGANGITYLKTADDLWVNQEDGTNLEFNNYYFGLLTSSGTWSLNPDGPHVPAAPRPVPQDLASRVRISEKSPVGTIVTSTSGESYTKINSKEWADTATRNFKYRTGEFASKMKNNEYTGDYFVQGFDDPKTPSTPSAPSASTPDVSLPATKEERQALFKNSPIGSSVYNAATNTTYMKQGDNKWVSEAEGFEATDGYLAVHTRSDLSNWRLAGPVAPTSAPQAPIPLPEDRAARQAFLAGQPDGTLVSHPRGREFTRVSSNTWHDNYSGEWNDAEVAQIARSEGWTATPPAPAAPAAPEAPAGPVIHDKLAVGTFLPSAAGSTSGMKRVGDDKWEMMKDGQGTGRFVNDDTVKIFQELMGTTPTDDRYGNNVGMYAADLKLPGGKSLGKFLEDGGKWSDLNTEQRTALKKGYDRFVENLNTLLPEGFSAKVDYVKFESYGMQTSVSFYQNGRDLGGPASRRFYTSPDGRTGKQMAAVDHAYWALPSSVQGAGLSAAFLKASTQMYRQMGLDRVTVHADISVGSYAWARSGFDFRSPSYMSRAMDAWEGDWGRAPRGREAEWAEGIRQFNELKARATRENFMNGTHPSPAEFANIGRPTNGNAGADATWFGKVMLSNTHWYGDLPLNSDLAPATVAPSV